MHSILLNRFTRRVLLFVIWCALVLALAFGAGLRLNPTPSLPKGIYRIFPNNSGSSVPAKGDLVAFVWKASSHNWPWSVGIWSPVPVLPASGHCSNVWQVCPATQLIRMPRQSVQRIAKDGPCLRL